METHEVAKPVLIAEAIEFVETNVAEIRFRCEGGEITSETAFELAHRFNVYNQLVEALENCCNVSDGMKVEVDHTLRPGEIHDENCPLCLATAKGRTAIAAARGGAA